MDWKAVAKTFASVGLPILANAIAPGSGSIVALVANALGLGGDATPQQISDAVSTNPDNIVKLKALQDRHEEVLVKAGYDADIEEQRIAEVDRDSARKRQIELKDNTPQTLAYILIGGFIAISAAQLIALMGWADAAEKIPPQGWLLIGNISGYLAGEAKQAGAYFFGTTASGGRKDDTIATIARQP